MKMISICGEGKIISLYSLFSQYSLRICIYSSDNVECNADGLNNMLQIKVQLQFSHHY